MAFMSGARADVPHPAVASTSSASRNVFALVIGIDSYKSHPLRGCVADSENISGFIQKSYGISRDDVQTLNTSKSVSAFFRYSAVPRKRIIILQNEAATRQNIISAFRTHLINNHEIKKGDAMIFFFAGHGSRQKAPEDWYAENDMMETICPYDYAPEQSETTTEGVRKNNNAVYGIPDRTIRGLCLKLAEKRGNNITVICDSCHSGGIGRSKTASVRRRYRPDICSPLPNGLDHDIWADGPPRCSYEAMSSYVVLGACCADQSAYEVESHGRVSGVFTTALVEALEHSKLRTSYSRLIDSLAQRLSAQHDQRPYCEGKNKTRIPFRADDIGGDDPTAFSVSEKRGKFYVEAGGVLGVVEGTEFRVQSSTDDIPATATSSIESSRCEVKFESQDLASRAIKSGSRAVVSHWNRPSLRVRLFMPQGIAHPTGHHFDVVDSDAQLIVKDGSGCLLLERCDTLIPRYAERHVSVEGQARKKVLNAVSHFNFYLYHCCSPPKFASIVSAKFQTLKIDGRLSCPTGENLFGSAAEGRLSGIRHWLSGKENKQSPISGEAMILDLGAYYGLTLQNCWGCDLFLYVFYFDPSDYHIECWYAPPGQPPSGLSPKKTLPIGYGEYGIAAIQFSLPGNATRESGFLKIFASTSPINMEIIKQEALISKTPPLKTLPPRKVRFVQPFVGAWHAWTYVLTCRRS